MKSFIKNYGRGKKSQSKLLKKLIEKLWKFKKTCDFMMHSFNALLEIYYIKKYSNNLHFYVLSLK